MEKTVKVRKDHECGACGEIIKKGEKVYYEEGRAPRHDENDLQIGIEYWRAHFHIHDCMKPESCEFRDHVWVDECSIEVFPEDSSPTGNKICEICFDVMAP